MLPFIGYWRQKKIRIAEIATPESRAADRTSEGGSKVRPTKDEIPRARNT